jgi:cysteine desulfurase
MKPMEKSPMEVYLDYAAATPLDPRVAQAMRAWDDAHFANAFSTHTAGKEARRALEDARFRVAASLEVRSNECVFVNGATNGTAMALHGVVGHLLEKGIAHTDMHIVMSVIEHSSVRSCVETLMRRGVRVSMVGVTAQGIVDQVALGNALRDDTVMVISMLVNNELGTIAPVSMTAALLEKRYADKEHRFAALGMKRPLLFVDASQATVSLRVLPNSLRADLLVIDAHKMYGPKRTGLLFVRSDTSFVSLCGLHGSSPYEGTPDVASAIGLACALEIAGSRRNEDAERWKALKARFLSELSQRFPDMRVHGDPATSVPQIANVSFPGIQGEFLAAQLDARGIAVSAKSACLSGGGEGSYVVAALDPERAENSVRFSFGRTTTEDDIDYVTSVLADIVRMRPVI